jgi:hypothetical protein
MDSQKKLVQVSAVDKKVEQNLTMVGTCPECGSEIRRPEPADTAVCTCHNPPILVPLQPEGFRRKSISFKRLHPLACPDCLKQMKYLSENNWECINPCCHVITLHKNDSDFGLDIKRATVL